MGTAHKLAAGREHAFGQLPVIEITVRSSLAVKELTVGPPGPARW